MRRLKRQSITEEAMREAPEESVRRLARYCGLPDWETSSVPMLIEELGWKGVVSFTVPRGSWY